MADDFTRFVGSIPQHYDQGMGPVIFAGFADLMAQRVAASAPERVLETAAGTGIVTRRLRERLPASTQIVATDLNPPMLDHARGKFAHDDGVAFQPEDATRLTFADGGFDAVVCQFGVMFFPDKDAGYREAHRVLAPGGRFHFSVWDAFAFNPFSRLSMDALQETFGGDPPPFLKVPFGYAAIDPIKASLHEAGFAAMRVDVLRIDAPIADPAGFARGLVRGSPLVEQIRSRGADPDALVAAVERKVRQGIEGRGTTPLQAIFFEAKKS